jgi:hypothetical protein
MKNARRNDMRVNVSAVLIAMGFLIASPVAHSATQSDRGESARGRLEQRADRLESRLRGKTGGLERQEINRQRREIDDVIRRIEAGEAVDPKEIDRILGDIPLD